MTKRIVFLCAFSVVFLLFYFPTLRSLVALARGDDAFTHLLIVPFISGYFFFEKRKQIKEQKQYSVLLGNLFILFGIIVWVLQILPSLSILYNSLSLKIVSMLLVLIGGMICLLGKQVLKNAFFPIAFLLLMIPLPSAVLDGIVSFYQVGTAAVVDGIFKISGIDYFRDGLSFYIPNLSISIAPQCSGIRSSTALIITGIIGGHLFLRTLAGKTIFILLTVPLVLLKNGIRVATLSLLGAYVNMSFINGDLHHKGGFVFFIVALVILFGVMFLIKKLERWRVRGLERK